MEVSFRVEGGDPVFGVRTGRITRLLEHGLFVVEVAGPRNIAPVSTWCRLEANGTVIGRLGPSVGAS